MAGNRRGWVAKRGELEKGLQKRWLGGWWWERERVRERRRERGAKVEERMGRGLSLGLGFEEEEGEKCGALPRSMSETNRRLGILGGFYVGNGRGLRWILGCLGPK